MRLLLVELGARSSETRTYGTGMFILVVQFYQGTWYWSTPVQLYRSTYSTVVD